MHVWITHLQKYSDKEYLSQLEARLEWLEKEKLELVKVLYIFMSV